MSVVAILIAVLATGLLIQALFSLWLMLDAWDRPDRLRATAGAQRLSAPRMSFSVLLPARDEPEVIGDTLAKVCSVDYPPELLEVIIICHVDDHGTIAEGAKRAIESLRLVNGPGSPTFDEPPINKPHGLDGRARVTTADVVTIFDAEDEPHPDILQVVNTAMRGRTHGRPVRRAADELRDRWFSA